MSCLQWIFQSQDSKPAPNGQFVHELQMRSIYSNFYSNFRIEIIQFLIEIFHFLLIVLLILIHIYLDEKGCRKTRNKRLSLES